jgi:NADPH:quinone reductase-like Zn-dependent oxidoreductase
MMCESHWNSRFRTDRNCLDERLGDYSSRPPEFSLAFQHSIRAKNMRTYSGVFALLPIFTGEGRAHQGEILSKATELVEAGKLRPLLNERMFSTREIAEAHDVVQAGSLGKVVITIQR